VVVGEDRTQVPLGRWSVAFAPFRPHSGEDLFFTLLDRSIQSPFFPDPFTDEVEFLRLALMSGRCNSVYYTTSEPFDFSPAVAFAHHIISGDGVLLIGSMTALRMT